MGPSHFTFPCQFSILVFLIIINLASTEPTNSPSNSTERNPISILDVLMSHGLPIGLFPISVSWFSLDPSSGRFQLHVANSPCDAKFETQVRFDSNVTGILSYGEISELSGVAAEELFLWLPVKSIQVDIPSSGLIYFDVGVVSKQFSLSSFETPRDCTVPAAEGADNHDNKSTPPLDLSFMRGRGRIIEVRFPYNFLFLFMSFMCL